MRETLFRRDPLLGVRFCDAATGRPVVDGLVVELSSARWPGRTWAPVVGPSGVYSWHDLPGFVAASWGEAMADQTWRLAVRDPRGRYLDWLWDLPLPRKALQDAPAGTFGALPGALPLYAAPSRQPGPELAVVRASLRVAGSDQPAAWARLELRRGGQALGVGYADKAGEMVAIFPWPEPPTPPGAPAPSLADQTWTLTLAARWQGLAEPALDRLATQPVATLLTAQGGAAMSSAVLTFGQPLILRSQDAGGEPLSTVLLSPSP